MAKEVEAVVQKNVEVLRTKRSPGEFGFYADEYDRVKAFHKKTGIILQRNNLNQNVSPKEAAEAAEDGFSVFGLNHAPSVKMSRMAANGYEKEGESISAVKHYIWSGEAEDIAKAKSIILKSGQTNQTVDSIVSSTGHFKVSEIGVVDSYRNAKADLVEVGKRLKTLKFLQAMKEDEKVLKSLKPEVQTQLKAFNLTSELSKYEVRFAKSAAKIMENALGN